MYEVRLWYTRIEIKKRDLQEKVFQSLGVMLSDPETLVGLGQIIPQWASYYEIYEDEDDSGELMIVIEVYR